MITSLSVEKLVGDTKSLVIVVIYFTYTTLKVVYMFRVLIYTYECFNRIRKCLAHSL